MRKRVAVAVVVLGAVAENTCHAHLCDAQRWRKLTTVILGAANLQRPSLVPHCFADTCFRRGTKCPHPSKWYDPGCAWLCLAWLCLNVPSCSWGCGGCAPGDAMVHTHTCTHMHAHTYTYRYAHSRAYTSYVETQRTGACMDCAIVARAHTHTHTCSSHARVHVCRVQYITSQAASM